MKYLSKFVLVVAGIASIGLLSGCAPGGAIPSLLGPGSESVLLVVLLAVAGYLLWFTHRENKTSSKHKDNDSELAAIYARLEALEKEMQSIQNKIKGDEHD